jgi:hypothetical protein
MHHERCKASPSEQETDTQQQQQHSEISFLHAFPEEHTKIKLSLAQSSHDQIENYCMRYSLSLALSTAQLSRARKHQVFCMHPQKSFFFSKRAHVGMRFVRYRSLPGSPKQKAVACVKLCFVYVTASFLVRLPGFFSIRSQKRNEFPGLSQGPLQSWAGAKFAPWPSLLMSSTRHSKEFSAHL